MDLGGVEHNRLELIKVDFAGIHLQHSAAIATFNSMIQIVLGIESLPLAVIAIAEPAAVADSARKNCTVPVNSTSIGFVRTTWVVQPLPSAKCGNTTVCAAEATPTDPTGSVVIKNSLRSLV